MNSQKTLITPELANYLLGLRWHRQRRINKSQLEHLKSEIEKGRFLDFTTITVAQLPDGQQHLIDGQHRLQAIIDTGINCNQYVNYENVKDENELMAIWTRLDVNIKRSVSDSIYAFGLTDKFDLTRHDLNRLSSSLNWISGGFRRAITRVSHEDRVSVIESWCPYFELYKQSIKVMESTQSLHNANLVSLAIITFKYQPDKAHLFWNSITNLSNLDKNPPIKKFVEFMYKYSISSTSNANFLISKEKYSRYAISLWNNFISGRNKTRLQVNKDKEFAPVTIEGTPLKDFGYTPFMDLLNF